MRNRFDEQLYELNREIIEMGAMCEEAIASAAKALTTGDMELAGRVKANSSAIDQMERDIEGRCMKLLLHQQPVARDLRQITAAMKMITDLERIGDKGKRLLDFYDYRKKRGKEFSPEAMKEIRDLYRDARQVLAMALSYIDIENDKGVTREALAEMALRIRKGENELRNNHAQRLSEGKCSAESGLVFIDVLGAVEQIAYRSRKIADHMSEKRGE